MNNRKLQLTVALLALIVVWLFAPAITILAFDPEDPAALGDSFGTINTLFSGIALIFVAVTAYLQQKQINLQRGDIDKQRAMLERNALDQTILYLFKTFQAWIDRMEEPGANGSVYRGRACFLRYLGEIEELYDEGGFNSPETRKRVHAEIFERHDHNLAPYFRTLKMILETISSRVETDEDRDFYVRSVRAQLTPSEMVFIFYQCVYYSDRGTLRDLVSDLGLLKEAIMEDLYDLNDAKLDEAPKLRPSASFTPA